MNEFDPGPFAPVVGYVGAILAAVFLIGTIWRGKISVWRSPDEDLPDTIQKIVGVLCGVGMVVLWLYITVENLDDVVRFAISTGVILIIAFILYALLLGVLTYEVQVAANESSVNLEKIVGGFWLKEDAKKIKKSEGVTNRELLKGAAYDPDKLWDPLSRGVAKSALLFALLSIMVSGTLSISAAGFIVQVKLTGKAPSAVIKIEDAPGIE